MYDGEADKERLRGLVQDVLVHWGPTRNYMVSQVVVLAEIIDENGQPTVINVNTLGNNPWMLLGLLHAEMLRMEERIGTLNRLTTKDREADDEIGD